MIRYGAKTIAAGGYFAMPKTYGDGFLLVGDCAGLNSQRRKAIYFIKSACLCRGIIFTVWVKVFSAKQLESYENYC